MTNEELSEIEKLKDSIIKTLSGGVIQLLLSLPKEKRIEHIRTMSDKDILSLSDNIAMEAKAYEICAAAQIVKAERGLK